MSLPAFNEDLDSALASLDEEIEVSLDWQTRRELALLSAVYQPETVDEVVRRAIHLLTQDAVDRGSIDYHLRTRYDITYDEYLAGMTYEEMSHGTPATSDEDDRRYRF